MVGVRPPSPVHMVEVAGRPGMRRYDPGMHRHDLEMHRYDLEMHRYDPGMHRYDPGVSAVQGNYSPGLNEQADESAEEPEYVSMPSEEDDYQTSSRPAGARPSQPRQSSQLHRSYRSRRRASNVQASGQYAANVSANRDVSRVRPTPFSQRQRSERRRLQVRVESPNGSFIRYRGGSLSKVMPTRKSSIGAGVLLPGDYGTEPKDIV